MIASRYSNNRNRLIGLLKNADAILIVGNANVIRNGDTAYPFRQDSNLLYLCGVENPSISLFIDLKQGKTFLVMPDQSSSEILFEGEIDKQHLLNSSGCDDVINYQELYNKLTKHKDIYANLTSPNKVGGGFNNAFRQNIYKRLVNKKIKTIDIRPKLALLRSVKQDYEIKAIKTAVKITKQSLCSIEPSIWTKPVSEQSLSWAVTAEFAKHSVGHAYPPIVASGANAATLHINPSSAYIKNSVLFDVGAEFSGYSADISRTYFSGSNPIYDNLCDIQKTIISEVKPGVYFKDIQELSINLLDDLTKKHGLKESIKLLFPHSIGHHLGLDTHDPADYSAPLEENMVITIEPGLYSKKLGIGMRVEDDILITSNGATVL
jgi:Xaa-Pro aminopeptidase